MMLKCNHSWGGHVCNEEPDGLLCFVRKDFIKGTDVVHVDISCDKFVGYHDHHGGIIPLIFWKTPLESKEAFIAYLDDTRDLFRMAFSANVISGGPKKEAVINEAMTAYDGLRARIEELKE